MTTRAEFLAIVRTVARRTGRPETAVIAALVSRVERNASAATDPARAAHLDQVAAAMADEIGPALERDIRADADRAYRRGRRRYGPR